MPKPGASEGPGEIVELKLAFSDSSEFIEKAKNALLRASDNNAEISRAFSGTSSAAAAALASIASGGGAGDGSGKGAGGIDIQEQLEKIQRLAAEARTVGELAQKVESQSEAIATNLRTLFSGVGSGRASTQGELGAPFTFGGIANPSASSFSITQGGRGGIPFEYRTGDNAFAKFRGGSSNRLSRAELEELGAEGGQLRFGGKGSQDRIDIAKGTSLEEILSRIQAREGTTLRANGNKQDLEKFIGVLTQANAAELSSSNKQLAELRRINRNLQKQGLPGFPEDRRGAQLALSAQRDTRASAAEILRQFNDQAKRSTIGDPQRTTQQRFVQGVGAANIGDFKEYVELQKELAQAVTIIKGATRGILDPGTVQRLGAAYNTVKRNLQGTNGVVALLERMSYSISSVAAAGQKLSSTNGQLRAIATSAAELDKHLASVVRHLNQIGSANVNLRVGGIGNINVGGTQNRTAASLPSALINNVNTISKEAIAIRNEIKLLRGAITAQSRGSSQSRRSTFGDGFSTVDSDSPYGRSGNFQNQNYGNLSGTLLNPGNIWRTQSDHLKGMNAQLDIAYKRVTLYAAAASSVYGVVRAFQSAAGAIADVDERMAKLRFLMNDVRTNFTSLQKEAFGVAKTFGFSINETLDAMVVFAQQGRNMTDTIKLVESSLSAANQTTLSATKATEALTAAMSIFNVKAEDSIGIVDSWANVANKNAVSAEVLSDAMRKVGGAAVAAGIDFNELNALITTIAESTRKSGQEIGTSLKFIFQRIAQPETIATLEKMNIAVLTASGSIRPLIDILQEVSEKISTFGDVQRRTILTTIAGIRHYSDLNILLKNLDKVYKVTGDSQNAFGTSARNNEIVLRTLVKEYQNLKTAFSEVAVEIGSGGLIDFVRLLTGTGKAAAEALKLIPDSIKGAVTAGGLFVVGISAISTALNALVGTQIPSLVERMAATANTTTKATTASVKHSTVLARETQEVLKLARAYASLAATATGATGRFGAAGAPLRSTFGPGYFDDMSKTTDARGRFRYPGGKFAPAPTSFSASPSDLLLPVPVGAPYGGTPRRPPVSGLPAVIPAGGPLVPYIGAELPSTYVGNQAYPGYTPPGPGLFTRFGRGTANFLNSGIGGTLAAGAGIVGSGYLNSFARDEREQLDGRLGAKGLFSETASSALFGGSLGVAFGGAGGAAIGAGLGGAVGFIGAVRDYSSQLERALITNRKNLQVFNDQLSAVQELQRELDRISNIQIDTNTGAPQLPSSVSISPLRSRRAVFETIAQVGNTDVSASAGIIDKLFPGGVDETGAINTRFSESIGELADSNKSLEGFIADLGEAMDELKGAVLTSTLNLGARDVQDLQTQIALLRSNPGEITGNTAGGAFNQLTGGAVANALGRTSIVTGDIIDAIGLESIGDAFRRLGQVNVARGEIVSQFGKIEDPRIASAVIESTVNRLTDEKIKQLFDSFRTLSNDTGNVGLTLSALEAIQDLALKAGSSLYTSEDTPAIVNAISTGNKDLLDKLAERSPQTAGELSALGRDVNQQFFNVLYRQQRLGALNGDLDSQRAIIERNDFNAAFQNVVTPGGIDARLARETLRANDVIISGNRQEIVQSVGQDGSVSSIGLKQNAIGLLEVEKNVDGTVKTITRTAQEWEKFASELDSTGTVFARVTDRGRSFSGFIGDLDSELNSFEKTMGRVRNVLSRELSIIRREIGSLSTGGDSGADFKRRTLRLNELSNSAQDILDRRGVQISSADLRKVSPDLAKGLPGFDEFVDAQVAAATSLAVSLDASKQAEERLRESVDNLNATISEQLFQQIKAANGLPSALEENRIEQLRAKGEAGVLTSEDVRKVLSSTTLKLTPAETRSALENPAGAADLLSNRLKLQSISGIDDGSLPRDLTSIRLSVAQSLQSTGTGRIGLREMEDILNQATLVTGLAAETARRGEVARIDQFEANDLARQKGDAVVTSEFGTVDLAQYTNVTAEGLQKIEDSLVKLQQLRIAIKDAIAGEEQQQITNAFAVITDAVKAFGTALSGSEIEGLMSAISQRLNNIPADKAAQGVLQLAASFASLRDELGRSVGTRQLEESLTKRLFEDGTFGNRSQEEVGQIVRDSRRAAASRTIGSSIGQAQESIDLTLARQEVFGVGSEQDITQSLVSTYKTAVDGLLLERQRLIRDGYDAEVAAIDKLIDKYKEMEQELQAQQDALKPFAKQLDEAIASAVLSSGDGTLVAFDDRIKETISNSTSLKQFAVESGALPGVTTAEAEDARRELKTEGDRILQDIASLSENIRAAFADVAKLDITFNGVDDLKKQLADLEANGVNIPVKFTVPGNDEVLRFQGGEVLSDKTGKAIKDDNLMRGGTVTRDGVIAKLHHNEVVVPSSLKHLLPEEITSRLGVVTGNTGMPSLQSGGIIRDMADFPFGAESILKFFRGGSRAYKNLRDHSLSTSQAYGPGYYGTSDILTASAYERGHLFRGELHSNPSRILRATEEHADILRKLLGPYTKAFPSVLDFDSSDPYSLLSPVENLSPRDSRNAVNRIAKAFDYFPHPNDEYAGAVDYLVFNPDVVKSTGKSMLPGDTTRFKVSPFDRNQVLLSAGGKDYDLDVEFLNDGKLAFINGLFSRDPDNPGNPNFRSSAGDLGELTKLIGQLIEDSGAETFDYTPQAGRQQRARVRLFERIRKQLGLPDTKTSKLRRQVLNSPAVSAQALSMDFFDESELLGAFHDTNRSTTLSPTRLRQLDNRFDLNFSRHAIPTLETIENNIETIGEISGEGPAFRAFEFMEVMGIPPYLLKNPEFATLREALTYIDTGNDRELETYVERRTEDLERMELQDVINRWFSRDLDDNLIDRVNADAAAFNEARFLATRRSTVPAGDTSGVKDFKPLEYLLEGRRNIRKNHPTALSAAAIKRLLAHVLPDITLSNEGGGYFHPDRTGPGRIELGLRQTDPDTGRVLGSSKYPYGKYDNFDSLSPASILDDNILQGVGYANIQRARELLDERGFLKPGGSPEAIRVAIEDLKEYTRALSNPENFDLNSLTHERFHDVLDEIVKSDPSARALLEDVGKILAGSEEGQSFGSRVSSAYSGTASPSLIAEEFINELLTGDIDEGGFLGRYKADPSLLSKEVYARIADLINNNKFLAEAVAQTPIFASRRTNELEGVNIGELGGAREMVVDDIRKKIKRLGIPGLDKLGSKFEFALKNLPKNALEASQHSYYGFGRKLGRAGLGTLAGGGAGFLAATALTGLGLSGGPLAFFGGGALGLAAGLAPDMAMGFVGLGAEAAIGGYRTARNLPTYARNFGNRLSPLAKELFVPYDPPARSLTFGDQDFARLRTGTDATVEEFYKTGRAEFDRLLASSPVDSANRRRLGGEGAAYVRAQQFLGEGDTYQPYRGTEADLVRQIRLDRLRGYGRQASSRLGKIGRGAAEFAALNPLGAVIGARSLDAALFTSDEQIRGELLAPYQQGVNIFGKQTFLGTGSAELNYGLSEGAELAGFAGGLSALGQLGKAIPKLSGAGKFIGGAAAPLLGAYDIYNRQEELKGLIKSGRASGFDIAGRSAATLGVGAATGGGTGAALFGTSGLLLGTGAGAILAAGALTAGSYSLNKQARQRLEDFREFEGAENLLVRDYLRPFARGLESEFGGANGDSLRSLDAFVLEVLKKDGQLRLDHKSDPKHADFLRSVIGDDATSLSREEFIDKYAKQQFSRLAGDRAKMLEFLIDNEYNVDTILRGRREANAETIKNISIGASGIPGEGSSTLLKSGREGYIFGVGAENFRSAYNTKYGPAASNGRVAFSSLVTPIEQADIDIRAAAGDPRARNLPFYISDEQARDFLEARIINAGQNFDMFGGKFSGLNLVGLEQMISQTNDERLRELGKNVLAARAGGIGPIAAFHRGGFAGSMGMMTFGRGDMEREVIDGLGNRRLIRDDEVVVPQSILNQGINDDITRRIPGSENRRQTASSQNGEATVERVGNNVTVRLGGGFQFINQGGGNMNADEIRKTIKDSSKDITEGILRELLDKPMAIY